MEFLNFVVMQSLDEAETKLVSVREHYKDLKLTLQPLVFEVEGGNSFVAYNHYRWSFNTPVKAMDVCFKLIHVSVHT